jgi:DNA sulfur modification protein DndD
MKYVNLKSIELYNFRQFKEAKVEFAQNKKKPFNVIEGKNGFGKSNLLNALTWCFYGTEEHLKNIGEEEAEPIINTREINKLREGERISAKVIIKLATDKGDIRIEREVWGRKSGGRFYLDESTTPQILQQNDRGNWDEVKYPTFVINRILPQIVTRFFFFDGEQLRQFFGNISQEDVKNAIFDISQVSLIENAITSLNKVLADYRAEDKSDDPELIELKGNIDFYKSNLEKVPGQIKEFEVANSQAKKNISIIDTELRSSSIEVIKRLQEERDSLQTRYDNDQQDIEEAESELAEFTLGVAPTILTKKAIEDTLKTLSKLSMEGILPPKIEDTFVRELLDIKKECICGTKLDAGAARQRLIKLLEDRKLKEGVAKEANELKYELNPLLRQVETAGNKEKTLVVRIETLKDRLKKTDDELKEVSAKLKKYGEVSKNDLLNKEKERDTLNEAIRENIEKIAALKLKGDEYKRQLKEAENEYDKLSKEVIKNKKLLLKKECIKKGITILENIKDKLINELRVEIEKNTKNFFTKMVSAKTFEDLSIGEDYRIKVVKSGQQALKSLSVGETLLLGLSFMAALRKVSGFVAPVVIDTPLAPIDKDYRSNLIDFMSTALEDTQIVLLVKDTEYTEEVKDRLKEKVCTEKLLKHDKQNGLSEVVDYE